MDTIAIHIPATPELTELVKEILKHPDVRVNLQKDPEEFLTVKQAAAEAKMSYSAFRRQVVDKKRVKATRPTGPKGDLRIKRADLIRFLENPKKAKTPGRKASGVKII